MGDLGGWRLVDTQHRISAFANQGLVTVRRPGGSRQVLRRGFLSNPYLWQRRPRWVHIGDPGAWDAYVVDCYQGRAGRGEKMFRLRLPAGGHQEHVHPVAVGETINNSFVALSADGHWMVSGEWEQLTRLLVFPTPALNPRAGFPDQPLPLAGIIELDRPVRRPQGITFLDPVTMLCSTDDPTPHLWGVPRQLLRVTLARPLAGEPTVPATVTFEGALPTAHHLAGGIEVEGLDYDPVTTDLRVSIVRAGRIITTTYRYRLA